MQYLTGDDKKKNKKNKPLEPGTVRREEREI